jgi:hypothetical protein
MSLKVLLFLLSILKVKNVFAGVAKKKQQQKTHSVIALSLRIR